MKITKRSGELVEFNTNKINNAICKAMKETEEGIDISLASKISNQIYNKYSEQNDCVPTVELVQDDVEKLLAENGRFETSKLYILYREDRAKLRTINTTDEGILGLLNHTNEEVMTENSNKNPVIASTQRDLIAGEVSKDISKRKILPYHLTKAHEEGLIHIHDMDYLMQPIFNCFSGDTEFITHRGIKRFNQFNSGDKTKVVNKNGAWCDATVNKYGNGKLQTITLRAGRSTKTLRASYNHRWILQDGTVTEDLQVEDKLFLLPSLKEMEIDDGMFSLGFILGDGSDYENEGGSSIGSKVRLCGEKIKLKELFVEQGYTLSKYNEGEDLFFTKNLDYKPKQQFKAGEAWRFLNQSQLNSLFLGYYEADGSKDRNQITTSCPTMAKMIREISCVAGYYISSEKKVTRDTNFKKDATLYIFNFRKSQIPCNVWKVVGIDRSDLHDYDLWCVEERSTNSFTLNGGVVTGNCCLPNVEDMLKNGTVINGKKIDTPKSFQVACTVLTQIVAQIASTQYGGQSISSIDKTLAPYVKISYDKYFNKYIKRGFNYEKSTKYAIEDTKEEIKAGVQTIQYQINTLMTTNGQSPFLTLLLYFEEDYEYAYEASLIQEEILKQRIEGIKNEIGEWVTPAFPKLIYVLDEHNAHRDSKYYYITKLAAECTSKRMYPDYISAKHMRRLYEGQIFAPMGCRAFLTPYKNEDGEYISQGRFNFGVQTLNIPNIALSTNKDMNKFWKIFDDRMKLIKEMAILRYDLLKNVKSDVSPIHWQNGGIARLNKGEKIGKLLKNGYSTVTIGYIGIYEAVKYMLGESHTTPEGKRFALEIMNKLNYYKDKWTEETGLQFAVYGTPSENTAGRLCELDRSKFGDIKDITDKGFYTNSYHVDVREKINAFDKLHFESKFQELSTGGAISYIEIPNLQNNVKAIETVIKFMYNDILYAEFNTKLDLCHICKYKGEILIDDKLEWVCPNCGNRDQNEMTVIRRTCGYLGENFWSKGRTKDIKSRVLHL